MRRTRQVGRLPAGEDWIDRNFDKLRTEGLLDRRQGDAYFVTEKGAARAAEILQTSGCLNFHAFHLEKDFMAQHEMLKHAATLWLQRHGRDSHRKDHPGTQNHILMDLFLSSL